jgi:hypothetical protein
MSGVSYKTAEEPFVNVPSSRFFAGSRGPFF